MQGWLDLAHPLDEKEEPPEGLYGEAQLPVRAAAVAGTKLCTAVDSERLRCAAKAAHCVYLLLAQESERVFPGVLVRRIYVVGVHSNWLALRFVVDEAAFELWLALLFILAARLVGVHPRRDLPLTCGLPH